ncbi:YhgE/Pip family protein [Microbacterium sp. SORGH_AS_0888]|uniref:YhgE/Pip family protein n=1 Tax=Microbacterium sp. SORGH_AS_0888 TaxID=3041791 RepID=UPI002784A046|nr:YhgE/Pip family protein [Microbacterium sp. SORGH_AS_0888]MDQ1129957.1 putative membrane protein [Microbacterium sp. SORGH_AS_0888]
MKVPSMLLAELRRLTSTRMSILALVALMCVPVLYGGLYLWANQDPYGRLDQVPVGLVVADEGATVDGQTTNFGDQVADNLVEDGSFDWQRMDAATAAAALQHGSVDFTVTLPTDFSAALVSASGTSPHQATLALATNDANNYLASTIGSQAIQKIRTSVATMVGEKAALQLLDGLAQIRSSLVTATDGASQLTDGASTAASGAAQLASGAAQAADGAAQLADGTSSLSSGASQVASGAAQVADGASRVADGTATLDGYADRAGDAAQSVVDALPTVRSDIQAELNAQGLTPEQIDEIMSHLDTLGDKITSANDTVQSAVGQVDELAAGAAQVASGAAQVSDGAGQVAAGAASAASGAEQLSNGTDALSAGATTLSDGLPQLVDGAAKLRDGLAQGVAQIPDSDQTLRQQQATTISDPVDISTSNVATAGDYGAGLAPFFAALAGWIGIYALFLIVKPISRRAVTALHSPFRITLAGWLTPAVLGGVQMAALFGVLAIALGFSFANPLATLGIMVLASFVYASIILALNVWLGSVGQFLGLVLMVMQLVTAGGTFPWQTLPAPLAALHHVLPMGYVVDAMRQLMYGGDLGRIPTDVGVLLTWMLGALLLAAIGVTRMTHRRTLRDLAPSLIG